MNRTEHLLCILAEECSEVAQRVSKALRFGLSEVEPGQTKNNAERINEELDDLFGVFTMLIGEEILREPSLDQGIMKMSKVEKYLKYSREQGTLDA